MVVFLRAAASPQRWLLKKRSALRGPPWNDGKLWPREGNSECGGWYVMSDVPQSI